MFHRFGIGTLIILQLEFYSRGIMNSEQVMNSLDKKSTSPDDIVKYRAAEWYKCRQNPFYFIFNYVYISETGGRLKYAPELMHTKMRRVVRAVHRFHKCVLMASRQLGKALSLDTEIPLANGDFTTMRDIKVGDFVLDKNCQPTEVIATTSIMWGHNCYELEFNNEETVVADADHLWKVSKLNSYENKILTTEEIYHIEKQNPNTLCKILLSPELKSKLATYSDSYYIENIKKVKSVPVKCLQVRSRGGMFLCTRSLIPTHNSTIAACLIAWAVVFYSGNKAIILNMKQQAGLNNLSMIKFIISNLPSWMIGKRPFKSKSDIKTYFELFNNSRVDVLYPSTVHDPNTLARSLTVPVLYIDESAFISHMKKIYGSAQQTLATAREQAKKNRYPYFQLVTSTPNGSMGDGEWFYDRWEGAIESDDLFISNEQELEEWRTDIDIDELVADPGRNTFIRIQYHWREDPRKSEQWYQEQCQELADRRLINQELDLIFVGSSNCIFDDETLSKIKEHDPATIMGCPHGSQLRIFQEKLDPTDYYIIGCDTAESLQGADCAIQVYSFRKFQQIAELQHKFGSYTNFGQAIHYVFQWVFRQVQGRIILIVENNSIGKASIEYLTQNPEVTEHFNYIPFLFKEKDKDNPYMEQFGVKTTGMTKPLMIGFLVEHMTEDISCIRSRNLKLQCSAAYETPSGTVKFSTHSDLFMAACFCAFARKKQYMKIMPLVAFTNEELEEQYMNTVKDIAYLTDPKSILKHQKQQLHDDTFGFDEDIIHSGTENESDTDSIFPFFTM